MLEQMIGQIKAELGASKKKAAVLGLLLVVGMLVLIRAVVNRSSASAANSGGSIVATGGGDGQVFASGIDKSDKKRRLAEYLTTIDTDVSRNLFAPDLRRFPVIEKENSKPIGPDDSTAGVFSLPQLTLQSTLNSGVPTAIIDGYVVGVGQTVKNCRVEKIGRGYCIVSYNNNQFRLDMDTAEKAEK